MIGTLFDPDPEDARQPAKARDTTKRETEDSRISAHAPARCGAPETSHAAARRAKRGARTQAVRLLSFLADRGERGAINEEAVGALDLRMSSATARCRGLVLDGLVRDSGRTRPTTSGCAAIVWTLTDAGAAVAMSAVRSPEPPADARAEPGTPEGGAA